MDKLPTFEDLVSASGWTESDGPYPGVFSKYPAGEKFIGSCVWITDAGPVNPASYVPPAAQGYELDDYRARGADVDGMTVENLRLHLKEYVWPFGGRYKYLVTPRFRRGWPRPAWSPAPPVPSLSPQYGG